MQSALPGTTFLGYPPLNWARLSGTPVGRRAVSNWVALEQGNITQQKPHADVVHGAPGQHLLGQCHGVLPITPVHQAQHGAMRQAQKGAAYVTRLHFTPGDLAGVALGDVRLRPAKGPFLHIGSFVLQTQRP